MLPERFFAEWAENEAKNRVPKLEVTIATGKSNRSDRREKFVRISRRGRTLLRKIWKEQPVQLELVMAGLDESERRELNRLLVKMISAREAVDSATADSGPNRSG